MRETINEKTVLLFYLKQMEEDKVTFLSGNEEKKENIKGYINKLLSLPDIHMKIQVAKELWKILFEESMSVINPDKKGYDKLFEYFDDYVDFEELIFASDSFYRDHTLHCLWVYFLGEYLYNQEEFKKIFKYIFKENENLFNIQSFIERTEHKALLKPIAGFINDFVATFRNADAIRCLNALTHDLGYPVKKIKKINKSISNILPFFSINHFDEFNFTFTNEQKSTIDAFLDMITLEFTFDAARSDSELGKKFSNVFEIKDGIVIGFKEEVLGEFDEASKAEFIEWMTPKMALKRDVTKYGRYSEDFENYEHGIMSAFILFKLLAFNKRFKLQVCNMSDISLNDLDVKNYLYINYIYNAISDHTSPSYRIRKMSGPSQFLLLIDEIEEFSRISRADQNRQYISEFCKSSIYMDDDVFCVDFIFDNKTIVNLDPERAFKGRSKKMLSMFDIPQLDKDLKIKLRCLDHLWEDEVIYQLELSYRFAKITINGQEQDIPCYLKSRELYSREEYSHL